MKTPEALATKLLPRYQKRRKQYLRDWFEDKPFDTFCESLRCTQKEAMRDFVAFQDFVKRWQQPFEALTVEFEEVRWPFIGGAFRIPTKVTFQSPEAIFELDPDRFAEEIICRERACQRLHALQGNCRTAIAQSLINDWSILCAEDKIEYSQFVSAAQWLAEHKPANCFIREIPVPGIDTKWFEKHLGLLAGALSEITNTDIQSAQLIDLWQLKRPETLWTVRHIHNHICEFSAEDVIALPTSALSRFRPKALLIFENQQTALSAQADPDCLILWGRGLEVVSLQELPWITEVPVFYMGDLDEHGLLILAKLREGVPKVQSFLMNRQIFDKYRTLAVKDPTKGIPQQSLIALTEDEAELFVFLKEKKLRLEQERIPISEINAAIEELLKKIPVFDLHI